MARLKVTLGGRKEVVFEGPREEVERLSDSILAAMRGSVDTIITHELPQEPRSFLVSEIANLHPVELD